MDAKEMKERKKELRKIISERKKQYDTMQLEEFSAALLGKLEKSPVFIEAKTVLLYHSLKDEVRTHEFVEKWSKSKNILLPVVKGDELELRKYTGKHDMAKGPFGIEEPVGEIFADFPSVELAVIPGVSFDSAGNRLGRGKGYYDRLLPKLNTYNIGICYSFQVSADVPAEVFDRKMDAVLTEKDYWIIRG